MRKFFLLSVMVLCLVFFPVSAVIADDDTVQFDLTRVYYNDDSRTIDYDFSDGEKEEWPGANDTTMANLRFDDETGTYDKFINYKK